MRGDAGEQAKDGNLCLHCGGPKPPSLGTKPRKFCSTACCHAATQLRNRPPQAWPPICIDCGCDVGQQRRQGRRRLRCDRCRLLAELAARKPKKPPGEIRSCRVCGDQFSVPRRSSKRKCCSDACSRHTPAAIRNRQQIWDSRRVTYKCLNCEVSFVRKKYKSGAYSRQTKYCSRECAFEARRRRLPAAIDNNRKGGISSRLAAWFLSWGDDAYPSIKRCGCCGEPLTVKHADHSPPCRKCSRRKPCRGCGCELSPDRPLYISFCEPCRETRRREAIRRAKKKHGRNHRQRCRKYGAPYTPIRELDIYERDNWTCQICGCELRRDWDTNDLRSRTIDHIIPLSVGPRGPGHVPSNVRACCHGCNSRKSDSIEPGVLQSLH